MLCILTTSFNIARFEQESEMQRKALKNSKKLESSPFWNPESTVLESGIQYRNPEFIAWNPESKNVLASLTWGEQMPPLETNEKKK